MYRLVCAVDLCTLLPGEETREELVKSSKSKNDWSPARKQDYIAAFCAQQKSCYYPCRLCPSAGCIVFWKSSQMTSSFSEVFHWKPEGEDRYEGCGCTGLLCCHGKCMQSYSCAAAPLIHRDAKALTDASVWKCQIDTLAWDVYWLRSRVGWLLSKALILLDTPSGLFRCIPGLFGALRMSGDFPAFKWKNTIIQMFKKNIK